MQNFSSRNLNFCVFWALESKLNQTSSTLYLLMIRNHINQDAITERHIGWLKNSAWPKSKFSLRQRCPSCKMGIDLIKKNYSFDVNWRLSPFQEIPALFPRNPCSYAHKLSFSTFCLLCILKSANDLVSSSQGLCLFAYGSKLVRAYAYWHGFFLRAYA